MSQRKGTAVPAKKGAADKEARTVEIPRSVTIASQGIETFEEGDQFLKHLLGDMMRELVPIKMANCASNLYGRRLRNADMARRYAVQGNGRNLIAASDQVTN